MHLSIQIIRNILVFLAKGKSIRTIASESGVSKSVVNKLAVRIRSNGNSIEELLSYSDSDLEQRLYPRKDKVKGLEKID